MCLKIKCWFHFATGGVDYWVWQEKWTNGTVEEQVSGGKMGYHYSFGGQILLDRFDEASASLLEVKRGVKIRICL